VTVLTPHDLIQHPKGWTFCHTWGDSGAGAAFTEPRLGLHVIATLDEGGPDCWLHVSVSRKDRIPSYEDLHLVKRLFIGDHRDCVQYFPPRSKHVNLHPFCLHLWHCLTRSTMSVLPPKEFI